MTSALMDATTGEIVCQLLAEASRQFDEYTDLAEAAAAAAEVGWREDALCLIEEAGQRLANVRLLAEDVRDWGLDDRTGIVTIQARMIILALAVADAEYRRAVEELGGS
jgi:hypothetical protein